MTKQVVDYLKANKFDIKNLDEFKPSNVPANKPEQEEDVSSQLAISNNKIEQSDKYAKSCKL